MEKRNFNILVVSACIGLTVFWLTAYNVVRLGIDPIDYIQKNTSSTSTFEEYGEEEEDVIITFIGKVKEEFTLTLDELKSGKYKQITAEFNFINRMETEWTEEYTGATLWSILEAENILESDAETFTFIGEDGYASPEPLSIEDIANKCESQVILAYLNDGDPMYEDGPARSIVDREPVQYLEAEDHYNSQFAVKDLKYVRIE